MKTFNLKILFFAALLCAGTLLTSCGRDMVKAEKVPVEFRLAEIDSAENLQPFYLRGGSEKFFLHEEVLSDNSDIAGAKTVKWESEFAVNINFTKTGTVKWAEITGNNIGKRVGILINGELVTAPIIRDTIPQGLAVINGGFTKDEADKIAEGILIK